MKCPNCGAEVTGAFCTYCGSEMPRQPINIVNNYYGNQPNSQPNKENASVTANVSCPRCGSRNISFQREATSTRGVHKTIGLCKGCGNTWVTSQDAFVPQNPVITISSQTPAVSSKSKMTALILCIFLGYLGIHYFYVGKAGMGCLYLFTCGLFGFGWFIDIIRIACGSFADSNGLSLK